MAILHYHFSKYGELGPYFSKKSLVCVQVKRSENISPKTNTNEEKSRYVHNDWIGSSSEDNM